MRSIFTVLIGMIFSASAFAGSWDYSCSFGGGKRGKVKCTADGVLFGIKSLDAATEAAPTNTLNVTCNNGFELSGGGAEAILSNDDLIISNSFDGKFAEVRMRDVDLQGGLFSSTLTIATVAAQPLTIRGRCELSFTSSVD